MPATFPDLPWIRLSLYAGSGRHGPSWVCASRMGREYPAPGRQGVAVPSRPASLVGASMGARRGHPAILIEGIANGTKTPNPASSVHRRRNHNARLADRRQARAEHRASTGFLAEASLHEVRGSQAAQHQSEIVGLLHLQQADWNHQDRETSLDSPL